jgi:hypothetical protein
MPVVPHIPYFFIHPTIPYLQLSGSTGATIYNSKQCGIKINHYRVNISLTKQHQGGADGKGN